MNFKDIKMTLLCSLICLIGFLPTNNIFASGCGASPSTCLCKDNSYTVHWLGSWMTETGWIWEWSCAKYDPLTFVESNDLCIVHQDPGAGGIQATCPNPGGGIDGACGSANGTTVATKPTTNLCSAGTASIVNGSGPWTWVCNGSGGGTNATCSANKTAPAVNGACGSSNKQYYYTKPTTNLCNTGTPGSVLASGSNSWLWQCNGSNGGSNMGCFAYQKINGNCGSANGSSVPTKPTTNLCLAGTASSVNGSGPWTWTCNGINNGTSVSCSANKSTPVVNGNCGSADGSTVSAKPTTNLCSAGSASTVNGSGPWTWICAGSGGGSTDSCSANKSAPPVVINGACGSSHTQIYYTKPTTNLCNAGIAGTVLISGSNSWLWPCNGINGGATAGCYAYERVDAFCGSANGSTVSTKPTINLCSAGSASAVNGSGPWTWTCNGINGGTNKSCSANKTAATPTQTPGDCGSSDGKSFSSKPSTNLCDYSSVAPIVSGTGPWTWVCYGADGGVNRSCSANKSISAVDGFCGSADGSITTTKPTTNLCNAGSSTSVNGSGPWTWTCVGSGGGSTDSCSANKPALTCGTAHHRVSATIPTTNLCNETVTPSPVISGSGSAADPWEWMCGANECATAKVNLPGWIEGNP
ncbi:MAG: hypothetical protein WC520_02255 [Candidatus Paceibacterota bacterium]